MAVGEADDPHAPGQPSDGITTTTLPQDLYTYDGFDYKVTEALPQLLDLATAALLGPSAAAKFVTSTSMTPPTSSPTR